MFLVITTVRLRAGAVDERLAPWLPFEGVLRVLEAEHEVSDGDDPEAAWALAGDGAPQGHGASLEVVRQEVGCRALGT